MAILNIRIIGDPVLRTVADPVTEFGPELAKLVADMTETMEDVDGAGLAAPQVGVSQRVFTYRIRGVEGHIINPVLESSEDFQPDEVEGCLSIPDIYADVTRPDRVVIEALDLAGNRYRKEATGLKAGVDFFIARKRTESEDAVFGLEDDFQAEKKLPIGTI